MNKMTLSEELVWRGFVNQSTFQEFSEIDKNKMKFYFGVDPSAPSMTIGNLASAMMCRVFIKHGYEPVLLVGGATGLIGDPDGKSKERDLKDIETVNKNKNGIIKQYKTIFSNYNVQIVDNFDWFKDLSYLEFLRNVGKHIPMRQMLSRDFVKSRLGEDGSGISYAEFSYSLIQGYDFYHLHEKYGVDLQLCGADQWGNSVTGVDLIRRKTGDEVHVISCPLIINKATGLKFGKSEDGAVWLDEEFTSVYKFYQFWLNVDDDGCEDYLKIYTDLTKEEISKTINNFNENKASRSAQKLLAREVTKIVHGEDKANAVIRLSNVLFGKEDFINLKENDLELLTKELDVFDYKEDTIELLFATELFNSKTETRKMIESGAISINGNKITLDNINIKNGLNLVKKGKNSFVLVKK